MIVLPSTTFQGSRPVGGTSAAMNSSSSHLVSQQNTPPASLRGVSPGYQTSVEYNSCRMKGVFTPTPSPYDVSAGVQPQTPGMVGEGKQTLPHSLVGGPMDSINNKQVLCFPKSNRKCRTMI